MAQNEFNEIPVSYNRNQNLVRLLELPPDLLELIEASSTPHLTFKSAPVPQSTKLDTSNAPASHVVLTANDKTYQLRQVQTSNSVLLLESRNNGLAITAQCSSTLELEDAPAVVNASDRPRSAQEILAATLPVYTAPADLNDPDTTMVTRAAVYADIPLSDAELDTAWTQLAAFEIHSNDGHAWRPAEAVLKDLWRAILGAATIQSIDISAQIHPSTLWDAVETEHPRALFDALLRHLTSADADSAIRKETNTLDAQTVVAWVCQLCRPSSEPGKDHDAQQRAWVTQCQDLLPDMWHKHVDSAVQAALAAGPGSAAVVAGLDSQAADATPKSADKRSGPQRDWHARFKKTKR